MQLISGGIQLQPLCCNKILQLNMWGGVRKSCQEYVETRLQQNADKNNELNELYKAQLRTQYGIDEETESAISLEGVKEQWPFE